VVQKVAGYKYAFDDGRRLSEVYRRIGCVGRAVGCE
jgi:hypothetical protein